MRYFVVLLIFVLAQPVHARTVQHNFLKTFLVPERQSGSGIEAREQFFMHNAFLDHEILGVEFRYWVDFTVSYFDVASYSAVFGMGPSHSWSTDPYAYDESDDIDDFFNADGDLVNLTGANLKREGGTHKADAREIALWYENPLPFDIYVAASGWPGTVTGVATANVQVFYELGEKLVVPKVVPLPGAVWFLAMELVGLGAVARPKIRSL